MPAAPCVSALCLALCFAAPLHSQRHFFRRFDGEDGLAAPSVYSLAQDSTGFLWIGTVGGLYRYDGIEMRPWAPEILSQWINAITVSPAGRIVVVQEGGALHRVTADGAEPVSGPDGRSARDVRHAVFDAVGGLWLIRAGRLSFRAPSGEWGTLPADVFGGERPRRLEAGPRTGVAVATDGGVWAISRGKPPLKLVSLPQVVDLEWVGDDRILALTFRGRVWDIGPGRDREIFRAADAGAPGRGVALARRRRTMWVSIDRYLVAVRPGVQPEVLGARDGIGSGGPLLVDREGSLWMGSFTGLYQFPEPETAIWAQTDGLPSAHARYLAATGDTVWVTTWQGAGYLSPGSAGWEAHGVDRWSAHGRLFVDRMGTLWVGTGRGLLEIRRGRVVRRHPPATALFGFAELPDGSMCLGTDRGLLCVDPERNNVRRVSLPARLASTGPPTVGTVLRDRDGELWISSGELICHAPARSALPGADIEWLCDTIAGAVHLTGLIEMPSGTLWASTNRLGLLRRRHGQWEPLPGNRDLASRSVLGLMSSRDGGVWIVGNGTVARVAEDPRSPSGWRVLERLSTWHGIPSGDAGDLLESEDGSLWLTSSWGVSRVPAEGRGPPMREPAVAVVHVQVGGEQLRLDRSVELSHDRNDLRIRFAALSFRDPARLRYQVRLSADEPWTDVFAPPSFLWVDLPPGRYRAEVRASLDGANWSEEPAGYAFAIAAPWYRHPLAVALFGCLLALAAYAVYRARVAHLVGLEQQRTRIAMDLHDDIGSGLGSIGILSGILAADGAEPAARRRMAREVSETASELGADLSDIVWTLDPRATTLAELAARLADRGRRLFSGDSATFTAEFPDRWPDSRLDVAVRRNVLFIGLEALHNAAQHAEASRVRLRLEPDGRWWEMSLVDDGIGLPDGAPAAESAGLGIRAMHRRADEMGAEITCVPAPGSGTEIRLRFSMKAINYQTLVRRAFDRLRPG